MTTRATIAGLALMVLTGGCASYEATMTSWHGRHVDDLIFAWGPPSSTQRMSDGRQIVVYSSEETRAGTSFNCKVWFFATANGTIIKSDGEGTLGGCNRFFSGRRAATK